MDGYVTIGTELDTKGFDKEIAVLEDKLNDIKATLQMADEDKTLFSTREIKEMEAEAQKLGRRIDSLKEKQKKLDTVGFTGVKNSIESVGNSVEKVTKKVGRWALAVFGIRSAYMGIRNAINMISMQDEKLAADINYLKTALAYTLEPIVRAIVELMKQIVFYIGYIIKAWTGRDIFARANKNLKSAAKSAKQLKKELTTAGFDEMEILKDTSSSGGGGGGASPSFNLSDMEAPKWLQWIAKNKKIILSVIAGIVAGITAMRLGLKGIKALGIGIAVAGLVYAIQSLIEFLKNPTFENFIKVLEGIAIAVTGVAIAIGAWPVAVGAAIALVIVEIVKHFDEIKKFFNNLLEWMNTNFLGKLKELFGPIGNLIYMPFEAGITYIKSLFENFFGGIKKIIEGIVDLFKGNFKEGLSKIFSGLGDILLAPFRALRDGAKTIIDRIIGFVKDAIDWWNRLIGRETEAYQKARDYKAGGYGFAVGGGGSGSYGGGGSGGGRAKGGIFYPSLLPKLAVGGIINNPGAGVPYHGATIGERGAEAVVPLTQSEQMALLGEAIGRYVTINATIPVYAYNRQVDRQIQTIKAEDNFAFNK